MTTNQLAATVAFQSAGQLAGSIDNNDDDDDADDALKLSDTSTKTSTISSEYLEPRAMFLCLLVFGVGVQSIDEPNNPSTIRVAAGRLD